MLRDVIGSSGDECVIVEDMKDLEQYVLEGDWGSVEEFFKITGATFEMIVGKPFIVVHDRLFIED